MFYAEIFFFNVLYFEYIFTYTHILFLRVYTFIVFERRDFFKQKCIKLNKMTPAFFNIYDQNLGRNSSLVPPRPRVGLPLITTDRNILLHYILMTSDSTSES